jgi:acyl dehydratase
VRPTARVPGGGVPAERAAIWPGLPRRLRPFQAGATSMTTYSDPTYPPLLARGQAWEEMTPGSAFRTAARTITETDLVNFVTWGGFTEALFLDASHAAEGGYTGRLVPGALVFCFGEGLVLQTNVLNGTGLAFISMDLTIKRPAYVGDTIHVVVEVTEARAASNGHRGVVTTRNTVRNQRGEDVLVYTPVRLIRGRDYGRPEAAS